MRELKAVTNGLGVLYQYKPDARVSKLHTFGKLEASGL